jgi:hypothetical protein
MSGVELPACMPDIQYQPGTRICREAHTDILRPTLRLSSSIILRTEAEVLVWMNLERRLQVLEKDHEVPDWMWCFACLAVSVSIITLSADLELQ